MSIALQQHSPDGLSLGTTQRDTNYYEYLNDEETQSLITSSIAEFWEKEVKCNWPTTDCELKSVSYSKISNPSFQSFQTPLI